MSAAATSDCNQDARPALMAVRSSVLLGFVAFEQVSLSEANEMLVAWGHKMGALNRGNQGAMCHALTAARRNKRTALHDQNWRNQRATRLSATGCDGGDAERRTERQPPSMTTESPTTCGAAVRSSDLFSELCGRRFGCLLADPPWAYECNGAPASWRPCLDRGEKPHSVEHYYDTMTAEQIAAMPVREIAEENSVLFLWATNPLMPEAFAVMKAWGYKYKTLLTWEKENGSGMGYWFRGVTEHVLLGVRGDVKAFRSPIKNLVRCNKGRHSAKPEQVHDIIESVTQGMERLELFARLHRPRWTAWGNQVERDLYSPNDQAHPQPGAAVVERRKDKQNE